MVTIETEYKLTSDEQGMIKPLIDAIETGQKEAQAVLRAIIRLRGLEGNWTLAGDKLVMVPSPNGNG